MPRSAQLSTCQCEPPEEIGGSLAQLVKQATADAGVRTLPKKVYRYCPRNELSDEARRGAIKFCCDSTPKRTKLQDVVGRAGAWMFSNGSIF